MFLNASSPFQYRKQILVLYKKPSKGKKRDLSKYPINLRIFVGKEVLDLVA